MPAALKKQVADELADPLLLEHREAFKEQATEALLRTAFRYAKQRAELVRRAGRRIDALYPREAVQDALVDTWAGTLAWDPARCSLLDHIRGAIRTRTWKHALGALNTPHESLGADDNPLVGPNGQHATMGDLSPVAIAALTRQVVGDLRKLANEDRNACAILRAWSAGYVDRPEVIDHTALSLDEYSDARARLAYLVLKLPKSTHEAVNALLRSSP